MSLTTASAQAEAQSPTTTVTSWDSIPSELRQIILKRVAYPVSGTPCKRGDLPKVAQYATVCREWKLFFEACTFRRLVLDASSLGEFDAIIRRGDSRLGYIQKLWLRVRLSTYDCPACDVPEDEQTQYQNNVIFTTCIQALLETLKLWDPTRHGTAGLKLMLSASSPSDTEHRFNRYEIKDTFPFHYEEDLDITPGEFEVGGMSATDALRLHFHRGSPPPLYNGHIARAHGTPLRFQAQRNERGRFIGQYKIIPATPIVKGLVMRRQFHREISLRALAWVIGRSFVGLEWFRFERTVALNPLRQIAFDRDFQLHLLPSLPKTLRQLSFTQWELPRFERLYANEGGGSEFSPRAQEYLPLEMAQLVQTLEQLCPPWQMGTAAFLQSVIELGDSPDMPCSRLKRITLHCSLPVPDSSRHDFASLVILAARAAMSLPQLEVMELWGACVDRVQSSAYIFRYCYEGGRPTIVWRSSGEAMVARPRIMASWGEVAEKYSGSTLACSVVPLPFTRTEVFKSRGTCIYRHLMLKELVFDPVTQKILEKESCEEGLVQQHGDALHSNPPNPASWDGIPLLEILGLDDDLATLQADVVAFDAEVNAFFQQHHS